jgi:uncharacterized RDD family membrane protein YckC
VLPALVGQPLASPARRAWAMGVDLIVVALLATASGYVLALALVLLAYALRGSLMQEGARRGWGWALAVVMLAAALYTAWDARRGPPSKPSHAVDAAQLPEAASDAERVAHLEAELSRLRHKLDQRTLREHADAALDDIGLSFGWGIVYFSLLPAWWCGQTLGKRLMKLRVVELTGRPITPLRALKRYGGYAAGLATGGLGFVQMLWEPNRQALHDKAAHTVVVDERLAGPAVQADRSQTPPPPG